MSQSISVLIVEDEIIIANRIAVHLQQFGYVVAGILARGESALAHCRHATPDILLLDINLKGKLDGIETALALEREGFFIPTIYLTANTDSLTFDRARQTRPHAFLEKPYNQTELHRAISLALQWHSEPAAMLNDAETDAAEAPNVHEDGAQLLNDRIFIRHHDQMVKLFLNDIGYISAERSYCHIHAGEAKYLLSIPMGKVAKQLHSSDFLRVHRSYVVNLRQVDIVADDHLIIGSDSIPVSKDQRAELLQRVNLIH